MAQTGSIASDGRPMTGARALVASLEAEGVEHIFGYPGGTVLDIYDALHDSEKVKHVLVRHEQAAVHAADGYARVTGRPGVALVTSGPGATNTVSAVTNAYMDSIPVVVIAGQVSTTAIGTDAFQEADYLGITLPVVKHSYLIKSADDIVPSVREAFHIASTGRPGPVVICIPSNVAAAPVAFEGYPASVSIPSYRPTYKGNARQVKQAVALIAEAERPVIIAGGGIISSRAEADLRALAEELQIPVAETLMARGSFPEGHRLRLGQMGMHGAPVANLAIVGCDLVIAVGTRFANRSTGTKTRFAPDAKVIHIDIDPAEIGKNIRVDVPIVGDAHEVLSALVGQVRKAGLVPRTEGWLEQVDGWRSFEADEPARNPEAIVSRDVFDALNELTAERDVVFTTEVGSHQMWAARYLANRGPRTFITSGGAGTMGFGFPAAIGVQLAQPDALVVCLAGDGSIQMNIQEMATVVEQGLPVKVVVFNNGSLGMVRQLQDVFYGGRHTAVDLPRIPDFAKLADAYGWQGFTVARPADVPDAVKALLEADGPALLDVQMPDAEDVWPMLAIGDPLDKMMGVEGL